MADPSKNQVAPPPPGFNVGVGSPLGYAPAPLGYAAPSAPLGYAPTAGFAQPGVQPGAPPPSYAQATGPANQNYFGAAQSGVLRSTMYGNDDSRPLQDGNDNFAFSEKSIRMAFIRKVYAILTVQLAVTIAIISMFFFWEDLKTYSYNNVWLFYVALVMTFVCIIALACCPGVRRTFPMNIIFLGIFTICEGFVLGVVASRYNTDTVLIAAGICAVVVLSLTIFAFQTKIDFTMCGGFLFVTIIVLMCFGFVMIFWRNKVAYLIYSCLGALVFSMYIVFDTQMMLGGKHKYSISPEEHIFAALNLYLDIVQLFMFLLSIVGSARGE